MTTHEGEQPEQAPQIEPIEPLFELGRVLATPGAIVACERAGVTVFAYIARHVSGDWGDALPAEDKQMNDRAVETSDDRIFSSYWLPTREKLWIITEWDRSATTALLPTEY